MLSFDEGMRLQYLLDFQGRLRFMKLDTLGLSNLQPLRNEVEAKIQELFVKGKEREEVKK